MEALSAPMYVVKRKLQMQNLLTKERYCCKKNIINGSSAPTSTENVPIYALSLHSHKKILILHSMIFQNLNHPINKGAQESSDYDSFRRNKQTGPIDENAPAFSSDCLHFPILQ